MKASVIILEDEHEKRREEIKRRKEIQMEVKQIHIARVQPPQNTSMVII